VLISAACASGAILGSAPSDKITALEQFGYQIGKAFQITDDTLDYMAKEEDFGKSIGKDLEEGKMTLPLIYTLAKCTPEEKNKTTKLLQLAREEDAKNTVRDIVSLIQKYKGIDYSLEYAQKLIADAKSQLNIFANCREKDQLNAVAEYILNRRL
jgi:octaprenyl-diphosphate synthase